MLVKVTIVGVNLVNNPHWKQMRNVCNWSNIDINLIIVRTRDALLVCNRHDAEKIKNLVADLPPELQ